MFLFLGVWSEKAKIVRETIYKSSVLGTIYKVSKLTQTPEHQLNRMSR